MRSTSRPNHHDESEKPVPTMIDSVRKVVVVTGAGFSAPSGLPVYRNGGAGWLDEEGEKLAHASRYGNHLPELWRRWHALAQAARNASPNAAHHALARWERLLLARTEPGSLTIVTQNVDGLHQRAGSQSVLAVHGSILHARRMNRTAVFEYEPNLHDPRPPQAPNGSRRTRPDVVLFGERPRHMRTAVKAVTEADLVLFAGTSGRVWPVAGLLEIAEKADVPTMLLNDTEWDHGHFDITIIDDVLALDQIVPQDGRP